MKGAQHMENSLSLMAETRYLDGPSARFAYRRFGAGTGVPLVLALRFRGTMDHWIRRSWTHWEPNAM